MDIEKILRNAGVTPTPDALAGAAAALGTVCAGGGGARIPRHFHIDRRAGDLIAKGEAAGDDDDLLDSVELARWLCVSSDWVAIGRHRGYGPPFVRISGNRVMYRRSSVLDWLRAREHLRTSEYFSGRRGRPPRKAEVE